MDIIKIGKFIAEKRKEKKLTQEQLAEKIGVTSKTISRWENGKTMPDYSILKTLCKTLDISINELFNGEKISKDNIIEEYDNNLVKVLKEYKRMKKAKNILSVAFFIILYLFVNVFLIFCVPAIISNNAKVEINTDISKYNEYIGLNAKEEYQNKLSMNEEIFPQNITQTMNVLDYKMVYYNPWDAQYLSYLVVDYDDEEYEKEVKRLNDYGIEDYIGYYSVTGFSNYQLLAMESDSYQGFVYAITDGKNKIIYVELIFCNYFYDIDYKKYINEEYLPDGFDATVNNSYRKNFIK